MQSTGGLLVGKPTAQRRSWAWPGWRLDWWVGWSLAAFALVATLTLFFLLHTRRAIDVAVTDRVSKAQERTSRRINSDLQLIVSSVRLLRDQIQIGTLQSPAQFEQAATAYRKAMPGIDSIAWLASDGHVISVFPPALNPADRLNFEFHGFVARLADTPDGLFVPLQNIGQPSTTSTAERVVQFPIYSSDTVKRQMIGAVALQLSLEQVVKISVPGNSPLARYLRVEDSEGRLLLAQGDQAIFLHPIKLLDPEIVPVLNESLRVRMAPFYAPGTVPFADGEVFLLVIGLSLAVLAAALVGHIVRSRLKLQLTTQAHFDALEALHRAAAMIGVHARPTEEVLERLMHAACDLLSVPKAFVCRTEANNMIRLVYHTGFDDTPPNWTVRPMDQTRGMRRCMVHREPIYVPNVGKDSDELVDVKRLLQHDIHSVLMFPLEAGAELIGVMVLADPVPRHFSEAERRLAQLWASQCSVTLVNQRLLKSSEAALLKQQELNEQVRRDAKTKETLLQEMNHRVKNNMAGIVGLLSSGAPTLPKPAQRWLDRVIGRIQTLAHAHDLFVGFFEQVRLHDLIDKTLAPIKAMMPPKVSVIVVGHVTQTVSTTKAVTLAMVLYELANNALEHGLGPRGVLTVTSECVEDQTIRLMIGDDGSGASSASEPFPQGFDADEKGTQSGMGLKIVRELVRRELRGRFELRRGKDGGTLAIVEMPLRVGVLASEMYEESARLKDELEEGLVHAG